MTSEWSLFQYCEAYKMANHLDATMFERFMNYRVTELLERQEIGNY